MLRDALDSMILSASGWRKVFAPDGEHGAGRVPSEADQLLAVGMGVIWGTFLTDLRGRPATVLVSTDSRPTGPILAEMLMRGLESSGCGVRYTGIAAAPEAMARSAKDENIDGFAYVSASHNPLGHNGVKFGIGGGVIGGTDAAALIAGYRALIEADGAEARLRRFALSGGEPASGGGALSDEAAAILRPVDPAEKAESLKAYREFLEEIAGGPGGPQEQRETLAALRRGLAEQPVAIVADLNGSARCSSVDREYLEGLGVTFQPFNDHVGEIAHEILPEGESLEPCRRALETAHAENPAALIGYVPDNDGDRGNLVIWDEGVGAARRLEAQEVFALSVLAEFAAAEWSATSSASPEGSTGAANVDDGEDLPAKPSRRPKALVVNGPTSHRVREIAGAYGAEVHEAEVGEANVVNRAAELRKAGYEVRLLGEGSNGGTITHPAAVRDPLNTITALLKLLRLPSSPDRPGPFEDWCRRRGIENAWKAGFGPADIVATLPPYTTTAASAERAVMTIETRDHAALKSAWEEIFQRQWSLWKDELAERYGFVEWIERNNEGTVSRFGIGAEHRSGRETGGLKVVFRDASGNDAGFLWMRGSGTEPVFRVMAELRGDDSEGEAALIGWHRGMVAAADRLACGEEVEGEVIPEPINR